MKISAINSNYEAKKSLKKNQLNNNANITTPSFEGMNKINKVSAKKLALAFMAGIAVTTPSLQSCATLPKEQIEQTGEPNENEENSKNSAFSFEEIGENIEEFGKSIVDSGKKLTETIEDKIYQNNKIKNYSRKNSYIDSSVQEKFLFEPSDKLKSFDLSKNDYVRNQISNVLDNKSKAAKFLDNYLLEYFTQNPSEYALPKESSIEEKLDDSIKKNDVHQVLNAYKKVSKKLNVTEREAFWNMPAFTRYFTQNEISDYESDYKKENGYYTEKTETNKNNIYNSLKDEYKNFIDSFSEDSRAKIFNEMLNRSINSNIFSDTKYSKAGETFLTSDFIATDEKIAAYKEAIIQEKLAQAEKDAHTEAKNQATEKATTIAEKKAYDKALKLAKAGSYSYAQKVVDKNAFEKAKTLATDEASQIAYQKAQAYAEAHGRITTASGSSTKTVTLTEEHTYYASSTAEGTASATVTTKQIEDRPTKDITETVTVEKEATAGDKSTATSTQTASIKYTCQYIPQVIKQKKARFALAETQSILLIADIGASELLVSTTKNNLLPNLRELLKKYESMLRTAQRNIITEKNTLEKYKSYARSATTDSSRQSYERKVREYQNNVASLERKILDLNYKVQNTQNDITKNENLIVETEAHIVEAKAQFEMYQREAEELKQEITEEIILD